MGPGTVLLFAGCEVFARGVVTVGVEVMIGAVVGGMAVVAEGLVGGP